MLSIGVRHLQKEQAWKTPLPACKAVNQQHLRLCQHVVDNAVQGSVLTYAWSTLAHSVRTLARYAANLPGTATVSMQLLSLHPL